MPSPSLRGRGALVCGGAGFIGSHLVDALVAVGANPIVAVDDFSLGREENLSPARESSRVRIECLDCRDLDALSAAVYAPLDVCFNLAVIPLPASLEHPRETTDSNVAITTAVCELGRAGGFHRLVQYSSSEVYGTAQRTSMSEDHPLGAHTPYAASKAATDLIALSYLQTFGLPVAVVRPFNTFGPRQNDGSYAGLIPTVVRRIRAKEPVVIDGDGEQTRDYTYVSDVVDATLVAATTDRALGRAINVGAGNEYSVNEVVATILEALDCPAWPVQHGPPRPGDVRRLHADIALAADLLGYAPTVSIEQGLHQTLAWYERDGALNSGR